MYGQGIREFSDIIKYYLLVPHINLFEDRAKEALFADMVYFLIEKGYNSQEVADLNYSIKLSKSGDIIEVRANNLITALWFSDVYPEQLPNPKQHSVVIENIGYTFNPKRGTLKKDNNGKKQ